MTKRRFGLWQRTAAALMSLVLLLSVLPLNGLFTATAAGDLSAGAAGQAAGVLETVADAGTLNSWMNQFDPVNLSTEHAGGIWTDKSVFTAAGAATTFPGVNDLEVGQNNFLVSLSALAANSVMAGKGSTPTDTVFVLDISGSMSSTELRSMVSATNTAIHDLLSNTGNRVGIVLYSSEAHLLLPLDRYTPVVDNGVTEYIELTSETIRTARVTTQTATTPPDWWPDWLPWENYTNEVTYIKNSKGEDVNTSVELTGGTYIQGGLYKAWGLFQAASVTDARTPILVLMSDGAPTYVTQHYSAVPDTPNYGAGNSSTAGDGFVTQLTAAWVKNQMAAKYGTQAYLYTLGLGVDNVANSEIAKAVLDPSGSPNAGVTAYWTTFKGLADKNPATMTVNLGDSRNDPSVSYDASVAEGEKYADRYFKADEADDIASAFQGIVNEISLKAGYYVTRLDGTNANASGYVTFVDEIGTGMQVKEIEGVLIGSHLYSGHVLAYYASIGAFGAPGAPTALGDSLVWAVCERLDIDTATAKDLLNNAYSKKQIYYDSTTGAFSNYIGWYGDAQGKYLGFWDAENPDAAIPAGAAFANKCYGMLGSTTDQQTNHASDMMYITIQVSKHISQISGKAVLEAKSPETVTFRIPASLMPVVTYQIQLNSEDLDTATKATLTYNSAQPIRLLYEVGLHSELTQLNVKDFLREGYQAKDNNGNYYIYTNAWYWDGADDGDWKDTSTHPDKDDSTGNGVLTDTTKNAITYAYFEPGTENEHYYFTEDVQIYVKEGNSYKAITQVPASATNTTYYYQHVIFTSTQSGVENAATINRTYEELSQNAVQAAINNNSIYVPKGTMHYHNHSHDLEKSANATGSFFAVRHQLVDAKVDGTNHGYELVYMGNNGRITFAPTRGLKLSKSMNDGSTPNATFTFDIALNNATLAASYRTVHVSADGTETAGTAAVNNGAVTVTLKPGESIYVLDLPAGISYAVTERKTAGYLQSSATGATGTVPNNGLAEASFVNQVRGVGSLTVVKQVTYEKGAQKQDTVSHKFPVTVTFQEDGQALTGAVLVDGQSVTLSGGTVSFEIADGQSVVITDIPEGVTYTVEEGQNLPAGYRFNAGGSTQLGGTVTAQGSAELISNVYTPEDVTIDPNTPPAVTITAKKNLVTQQNAVDFTFRFKLQRYDAQQGWVDVYLNNSLVTASVTMDAAGSKTANMDLSGLTFGAAGTYDFRVVEIIPDSTDDAYINGMTYDRTFHDFEIVVGDTDLDGKLQILDVQAVQHAQVDRQQDAFAITTDFTNTYAVGSTKLTIQASKILEQVIGNYVTAMALKDGQFSFRLYETAQDFAVAPDAQGELSKNGLQGQVVFSTITYTQAGTYYYVVKEEAGSAAGYSYDSNVYKIAVTVSEVDTGTQRDLQVTQVMVAVNDDQPANVTDKLSNNVLGGDTITFRNTYRPQPVGNVVLGGTKTLSGWDVGQKTFSFQLKDAQGVVQTVSNNGGSFAFEPLTFHQAGTYTYTIVEKNDGQKGITYDTVEYTVTVTVTDNGAGQLVAAVAYAKDGIPAENAAFHNSYKAEPSAPVVISGRKNLTGRNLRDGEFSFRLVSSTGAVVETVSNVGGSFTFSGLTYDTAGTYTYTVTEVNGGLGGITYDTAKYTVTVTVSDDGSGQLVTEVSCHKDEGTTAANAIVFNNAYTVAPAKVQLEGLKTLVGANLQNEQFTFRLMQGDVSVQVAKNDAHGMIRFEELTFNAAGQYIYTVREDIGSAPGYTYDENVYTITITVTDNGSGQLVADVQVPGMEDVVYDFQFFNRYTVNPTEEVVISGNKTLNGRDLEDGEFQFQLVDAYGQVLETVSNADGKFSFTGLTFEKADTYTYTVVEVKGDAQHVTYDGAEFTVTVTVTDDGNGKLKAALSYQKGDDSAESITFVNTYKEPEIPNNPVTGDSFHPGWMLALTVSSVLVLAAAVLGRKKIFG